MSRKVLKIGINKCKECPYINFGPKSLTFICKLDKSKIIKGKEIDTIPEWCSLEDTEDWINLGEDILSSRF